MAIVSLPMYMLSLKDLQTLSGLTANVVRIWEGRHDLLPAVPRRQKLRPYTDETLKRLLQLAILHHKGWKTTELATLSPNEVEEIISERASNIYDSVIEIQLLLLAAIDLNERTLTDALDRIVQRYGFEIALSKIVHPYLGCLKILSANKTTIAAEHFSLYLIKSKLIAETERLSSTTASSLQLAVFSPVKTASELQLLYLNYLLRKAGCSVLYLGEVERLAGIVHALKNTAIANLWVHLGGEGLPLPLDDYLALIRKTFPLQTIIVSGVEVESNQRSFTNVHLLSSDAAIDAFIKNYPFGTT